jgi:hypothetical protein
MVTTGIVLGIVVWLAVQVPIGMLVGSYIRNAQTLPEPMRSRHQNPTPVRRPHVAGCAAHAVLRS